MLRIKRVQSKEMRNQVYALRYRAYLAETSIMPATSERFEDKYDDQPNHVLWALTEGDQVVGSIRTTWFDPTTCWSIPEIDGYGEDLATIVNSGERICSGNRFVTDPERSDRGSQWAMFLLKYHLFAASFRTDYALAAVRVNHIPFYRRVLCMEQVSPARCFPGLTASMHLLACNFGANITKVYERAPWLRPKGYERIFVDDAYREVWEVGVPAE